MAMELNNPLKESVDVINDVVTKMQDPEGFFNRDYFDITVDIDELDDKLHEIIKVLRFYARSLADDAEGFDETVDTTEGEQA